MKKGVMLLILLVVVSLLALNGIRPQTALLAGDLERDAEQNTYVVEFFDEEQHKKFASAYVRVDPVADGLSQVFIQFWHRPESKIRSLLLDFQSGQTIPDLSLRLPDYASWPAFQFYPKDGRSVSFLVPDLGSLGEGSVNLEFLVDSRIVQEQDLSINIQLVFNSNPLSWGRKATALMSIDLPE